MVTPHAAKSIRIMASRWRIVRRQDSGACSDTKASSLAASYDGFRWWFNGNRSLEDDGLGRCGLHHVELPRGDRCDPLRRFERLDLQAQVAVDLHFLLAGTLHLLDPVAVPKQLEMLPGRVDHERQNDGRDPRPAPQLPVAGVIDL